MIFLMLESHALIPINDDDPNGATDEFDISLNGKIISEAMSRTTNGSTFMQGKNRTIKGIQDRKERDWLRKAKKRKEEKLFRLSKEDQQRVKDAEKALIEQFKQNGDVRVHPQTLLTISSGTTRKKARKQIQEMKVVPTVKGILPKPLRKEESEDNVFTNPSETIHHTQSISTISHGNACIVVMN